MRRTIKQAALSSVAVLMCLGAPGCDSPARPDAAIARPALIAHPVFFTLVDPADAPELIRDCDEWIAPIPGITSYACGIPYDSGRVQVDSSYDVGLVLAFATADAYAAYVTHPDHIRLQNKWRPRMRAVEIRDILDR